MQSISTDLYDMGFMPTGRESPVDEDAELWSNGHEVVCEKTGTIIDRDEIKRSNIRKLSDSVDRYDNSGRVKMPGGYSGQYNWGVDDDKFLYY